MSISDLILFPHIPEGIYKEYKDRKKVKVTGLSTLSKELERLFRDSKKGDKLSQLILFDFYLSINHPSVYKDNITGKRIEQRLSKLFALSTGDEISKENPDIKTLLSVEEIKLFDADVLNLICSNYREKGDLFFFNSANNNIYKLSIKSLVPGNKEINFGAFEFQSTIKSISGLEDLLNLQERGRTIKLNIVNEVVDGIGLGSSLQMSKIITYIKSKNKLEEYLLRFKSLLGGVYKDDFLVYIKNNKKFAIYLISNEVFINIILSKVENGFKNIRVEGNAIRVSSLEEFKKNAYSKFEFDFETIIPDLNKIESLVIKSDHDKLIALKSFISSI